VDGSLAYCQEKKGVLVFLTNVRSFPCQDDTTRDFVRTQIIWSEILCPKRECNEVMLKSS
jgi:hypothetical protein